MLCFEDFTGVNIIQSRCWKNHCRRLHKDFIKDRMIKVRWELYATFIYYIFIILCNITICDKRNLKNFTVDLKNKFGCNLLINIGLFWNINKDELSEVDAISATFEDHVSNKPRDLTFINGDLLQFKENLIFIVIISQADLLVLLFDNIEILDKNLPDINLFILHIYLFVYITIIIYSIYTWILSHFLLY